MKNKKGFTLIEVLAVIVIISILLLLAVPEVAGIILKSKISASKDSTIGFLKELDNYILDSYTSGDSFEDGYYIIKDLNIDLNKKNPTDRSWIYIEKGILDSYAIEYDKFVYVMGEDKKPKLFDGDFPIYKSKYDSCNLGDTFVDCIISRLNNDGFTTIDQPVTTQMKATKDYRYSAGSSYCRIDSEEDEPLLEDNKIIYDADRCLQLSGSFIDNVRNYVLFDGQLYRIVGVFETKQNLTSEYIYRVKLLKDDYLNSSILGTPDLITVSNYYSYGNGKSLDFYNFDDDSNFFVTSTISSKLNNDYYNSLSITSQSMIADNVWYLGGAISDDFTASQLYLQERDNIVFGTNTINSISKIGLIYPSDFGYSISPDNWNLSTLYYCNEFYESWMTLGSSDLTITHLRSISNGVLTFRNHYGTNSCLYDGSVTYQKNIRPTFYLKENIKYKSGNGTYNHPFIIEM